MDPQPGLPVLPSAADIARYNAWADRNGRPHFGQADPPAAAAAPAAARGRPPSVLEMRAALRAGGQPIWNEGLRRWELRVGGRTVTLTDARGRLTPVGKDYRVAAHRANQTPNKLLAWKPGTHMDGQNDVAYLLDGTQRTVRRWEGHIGAYKVTTWGKDYYANHASQFTVNVPVFRVIQRQRADGSWQYIRAAHADEGMTLNLTDQEMADYIHTHAVAPPGGAAAIAAGGIGALDVVPAMGTPERQRQWIREALAAYIAAMPLVQGFRLLVEFDGSECSYAYDDTREPTFDEETTTVRHGGGDLAVQLVLNRPLRGMVVVPDEMYAKTGLFPLAFDDNKGNCVLNQLMLCLTKRQDIGYDLRKRNRKWIDGKYVTVKDEDDDDATSKSDEGSRTYQKITVPIFKTLEQLEAKVQFYFDKLYPSRDVLMSGPQTRDQVIAEEVHERREQDAHDRRVAAANAKNYGAALTGVTVEVPPPRVPEKLPRTVSIRDEPYEFRDWRTGGISANLIADICEGEGMAVHVIHNDHLIRHHYPKNYR